MILEGTVELQSSSTSPEEERQNPNEEGSIVFEDEHGPSNPKRRRTQKELITSKLVATSPIAN